MRSLTSPEKVLLRTNKQSSFPKLAISNPEIIFKCRIDQVFSTKDRVLEFAYDGVTVGAFADVIPGMTALIGSSDGAFDVGIARVRKALTSDTFYIGETSEIDFDDDLYVTVLEDFNIWSKLITIVGPNDIRIDGDVIFPADEWNAYQRPVVRFGPAAFVVESVDGIATLDLDASTSYSPIGLDISEYLCECDEATITNEDTATPTLEFDAPGEYLIKFTVTDEMDFASTAYRKVFVDPASPELRITRDPVADRRSGGWSFEVEAWGDIVPANIHDKTIVVLWAHDYYGDEKISIGAVAGQEHIIAIGWIQGKSISWNPDYSSVAFKVEGLHYWLDNIHNKPSGVVDSSSEPVTWVEMKELTVDKGLFHLLYWRSTVMSVVDCYLTEDTNRLRLLNAAGSTIWEQMRSMAELTLKALPLTNLYGQLYVEIPIQIMPIADRAGLPVVMEIEKQDLREEISIELRSTPEASFLEISGISAWDGTIARPLFSHAPGDVEKHYGRVDPGDSNLLFADQDDCNEKAAMLLSWKNNLYPNVDALFSANLRMVDICPRHFFQINVATEDTALGIILVDQNLIVNSVVQSFDPDANRFATELEFEVEPEFNELSVTYIPPAPPTSNLAAAFIPPLTALPLLPGPDAWFPAFIPNPDEFNSFPEDCDDPSGPFFINWSPSHVVGEDDINESRAYCPCTVRDGTYIRFTGLRLGGDANAHITVNAIDAAGGVLLTAAYVGGVATFSPVSPTPVAGFSFILDVGGTGTDYQVFPEVVDSGVIQANDGDGDEVILPVGLWAIESYGGPFDSGERGGLEVGEGAETDTGEGLKWTWETDKRQGGWSGIYGMDAYGVFRLDDIPSTAGDPDVVAGFRISEHHARVYFDVTVSYTKQIRCNDNAIGLTTFPYGNNTGTLGWILRRAYINDREAWLKRSELYNVCA